MSHQGESPPAHRLKVAVLNRVFARTGGGAEAYSIAVVEQLASSHEVHVFAQQIDHSWPGVHYHRVSSPGAKPRWINQLWYAFATWRATRKGFDVVHSHENTWHGQVQTIHVRPLRFNLLGGRKGMALALRWLKIALSPRLLTYVGLEAARCTVRPGRVVAVASESLGREVLDVYPHVAPMLQVVPPGVALPPAGLLGKAEARRASGVPEESFVLLFVANDYARKGLEALLQALALLPPTIHLLVVGNPVAQSAYAARASQLGVTGRVVFAGALKDVTTAYRAADALVHPTLEDSFGMVVLEAMSHGVPVVVSSASYCGAANLLHDGVDALLLENPRDASAMALAIARLSDEPALCQALSAAALQLAAAHSWQAAGQNYARIYATAALYHR